MSLRLLQKQLGGEAAEASAESKSVVKPATRGRGRGGGYPAGASRGAPPANIAQQVEEFIKTSDIDDRSADMLREASPDIQQIVLGRGDVSGTRDPSQVVRARIRAAQKDNPDAEGGGGGRGSDAAGGNSYFSNSEPASSAAAGAPRVMAPTTGGFRGSSAQAAHIAATKQIAADQAREKEQEWKAASELAVKSGLGLKALEERKQREEEERAAKRDAARMKRLGETSKKELGDTRALAECEEQAWCDSEANERVKYEAALIVRIANRFGAGGVWTKIAEVRARGAEIPLEARKVYLLAHPDKCPLPEAVDATAILNAQRPPEMTESRASTSGISSKEAVGARVAAARAASELRKIDPDDGQARTFRELVTKYEGTYSEEELQAYWDVECQALPATAGDAPAPLSEEEEARRRRIEARKARASGGAAPVSTKATPAASPAPVPVPAPAPAPVAASATASAGHSAGGSGDLRKIDPDDGKACTFQELRRKYAGMYTDDELQAYWDVDCKELPKEEPQSQAQPKSEFKAAGTTFTGKSKRY